MSPGTMPGLESKLQLSPDAPEPLHSGFLWPQELALDKLKVC